MIMKSTITIAALLLASSALADNNIRSGNIKMNTALGWLGGESKEYVYGEDGNKTSELKWKIKNTAIIKGGISWDVFNWLTLNARGWTSLASSGSAMDDYDWLTTGQSGWSDWSTHPDTRLNYANEFDVNIKGWGINTPEYSLGAVLGYQQSRFSWTAYGGSLNYNNGKYISELPYRQRTIGYKQQFSMPYLGIVGISRYQDFEFTGSLKFSPWVKAKDNDEHYVRELTFRDRANNSRYYSATIAAGYYVTPEAKVFMELSYSKYEEGKGSIKRIDQVTGSINHFNGDYAGIENTTYSLSLGMQYQF